MYNVNQIRDLEDKIAKAIYEDGTDESDRVTDMVADIASPNTGLIYHPGPMGQPGKLAVAGGWMADTDGNIRNLEVATGPNGDYLVSNGVLVHK